MFFFYLTGKIHSKTEFMNENLHRNFDWHETDINIWHDNSRSSFFGYFLAQQWNTSDMCIKAWSDTPVDLISNLWVIFSHHAEQQL